MRILEEIMNVAASNNEPMDKFRVEHYGHPDKWPKDRDNAFEYFKDKPEIFEIILEYFKDHNGESLNHFDIAGRASFNSSEKRFIENVYCFVKSNLDRKNENGTNYIEGDIMSETDFERGLGEVRSKNILFDIVTFQPVGGLEEYSPDRISEQLGIDEKVIKLELMTIFLKRLYSMKTVIKTGGLLYLGESHLLSEYYKNNDITFRELFRKLGFEILIHNKSYSGIGKDKISSFLLKKVS